jgi:hypothetical protein
MAAISVASLARVQSGVENARAYADPVIRFLAAAHQTEFEAPARAHRAASRNEAGASGVGLNLLAVFFVGLVAPLAVEPFRAFCRVQSVPVAPLAAKLFERPPPAFLA